MSWDRQTDIKRQTKINQERGKEIPTNWHTDNMRQKTKYHEVTRKNEDTV